MAHAEGKRSGVIPAPTPPRESQGQHNPSPIYSRANVMPHPHSVHVDRFVPPTGHDVVAVLLALLQPIRHWSEYRDRLHQRVLDPGGPWMPWPIGQARPTSFP